MAIPKKVKDVTPRKQNNRSPSPRRSPIRPVVNRQPQSKNPKFQNKKKKKASPTPQQTPAAAPLLADNGPILPFPDLWQKPVASVILDQSPAGRQEKKNSHQNRKADQQQGPPPGKRESLKSLPSVIDVPSDPPILTNVVVTVPESSNFASDSRSDQLDNERARLVAQCMDDELANTRLPQKKQSRFFPPTPAPRQAQPQKRVIKFRPAYLMTCTGFLESLIIIALLVIFLLTLLEKDCYKQVSHKEEAQNITSADNSTNTTSTQVVADTDTCTSDCLLPNILMCFSAAVAILVFIHVTLYVYRIVIAYKKLIDWQRLDAIVFALLGIAFFILSLFNFKFDSQLLIGAASVSVVVAVIFKLISCNKFRRHWTGLPVQVYDDEDDFFKLRGKIRFQEIKNLRRYWLQ